MRIALNLFFVGFVCLTIFVCADGQSLKLVEASEHPNCEVLLRLLDTGSHEVMYNTLSLSGQVVLFPGPNPIENSKYEKYIRTYLVRRSVQERIGFRVADRRPSLRVEFWKGPLDSQPQFTSNSISNKLPGKTKPILFDSELFERFLDNHKITFVGLNCDACCISALDWYLLAEFLNANPSFNAYLVIRGRAERHRPLKRQLETEIKEAGIAENKVRYLYANRNLVNTSHFSEVAVFLSDKVIQSAQLLRSDFESDK